MPSSLRDYSFFLGSSNFYQERLPSIKQIPLIVDDFVSLFFDRLQKIMYFAFFGVHILKTFIAVDRFLSLENTMVS